MKNETSKLLQFYHFAAFRQIRLVVTFSWFDFYREIPRWGVSFRKFVGLALTHYNAATSYSLKIITFVTLFIRTHMNTDNFISTTALKTALKDHNQCSVRILYIELSL